MFMVENFRCITKKNAGVSYKKLQYIKIVLKF